MLVVLISAFVYSNALHEMFIILIFLTHFLHQQPTDGIYATLPGLHYNGSAEVITVPAHFSLTNQLSSFKLKLFIFYFKSLETSKVIRVSIGL